MKDPRWTTVDGLFEAALERQPHERAAFLRDTCAGDEALREEVESLLAHARDADDFLDQPAHELTGQQPAEPSSPWVGRQFGSYRIVGLLGTGGMGEVYRAHDTTLGRDVAIKILPRVFATDPERRARFDREARLLAALNHPHIGAIYGVEESDHLRALVLELVEGDTLADRLERGPLPIGEALQHAQQIADALDAAHQKGIIHRDLKPANIKITPQGVVKVLDFGLAKAVSAETSAPDLTKSPTVAVGGTHKGVILGTAAYMSPEQARGKPVDKRADIWAFGCVLYEMLTGRASFAHDTITDTLAAIIERDPSWTELPATTPAPIQRLLIRCLQKDPRRRLHDIADARIEIEDALGSASHAAAVTIMTQPQGRRDRVPWSIAAIASAGALVAVGALMWTLRREPQAENIQPRISRTTIGSSGATALALNGSRSLAITPDGSQIVYIGNNDGTQIFVRALDQLEPKAIFSAAAPLNWVSISPDGQWVGFVEGFQLKKVALTGGPAVVIAVGVPSAGMTWAPNNTIILGNTDPTVGLQRVSADGGDVTVLTRPDKARGELDHIWPEMLPGGSAVLLTITSITGGPDAAQVAVLDLATGRQKVVVRGGSHAHYVSNRLGSPERGDREGGYLVFMAGVTLRAVPFDLGRLETRGTPVVVVPRLVTKPQGAGEFVVATSGTLAYVHAPGSFASAENTLVWVDREGREEPLTAPPRSYYQPRVSPDGTQVAVAIVDQGVWVWNLQRQTLNRLNFDPAPGFFPVWTPDARRLLFSSGGPGGFGIFSQSPDAGGTAESLTTLTSAGMLTSDVSRDGTRVIFPKRAVMSWRWPSMGRSASNRWSRRHSTSAMALSLRMVAGWPTSRIARADSRSTSGHFLT